MTIARVWNLGKNISYEPCLNLQKLLVKEIKYKKRRNTLLLLEHKPVYTIGIREVTKYQLTYRLMTLA